MPDLKIPKDELPHVQSLMSLPQGDFGKLIEVLKATDPTVTLDEFADRVFEKFKGFPLESLKEVLKTLFALCWLKDRYRYEADELARDVTDAVDRQVGSVAPVSKEIVAKFAEILNVSSVEVTAKAMDVLTEHERIFCGARILTDMRPVFVGDGAEAPAALIVHQLQIAYHENGKHKELYFTLDTNDIDDLFDVAERAQTKTEALEKLIAKAKLTYLKV